jgi:hypothetical protein
MVTQQASHRNLIFVSFSQFGAASSFNFLNVFLPFYILNISPYSFEETLLWIGALLGSSGIVTAITSAISQRADGGIIGFLNSARFTGNAWGPMIATSILAFSSLEVVYLLISAISLLALLGFKFFFKKPHDPS